MCGRYTIHVPTRALMALFDLPEVPDLLPRYNVAPSQEVPVVRQSGETRELTLLRWGLIPFWSQDPKKGPSPINARAESAPEKPAFRAAFRHRRCLLPADGFYEWQKVGTHKQPVLFRMKDEGPFAFAGLWDRWEGPEGRVIESCTLLTTEPNELVASVHDRMPVILPPEAYARWLDPQAHDPARLQPLLRPYPAAEMSATRVSSRVNSPRADDAGLIAPEAPSEPPRQLRLF